MNRISPVMVSVPMVASMSPRQAEMKPLNSDSPDSPPMTVRAKSSRANSSGGPNMRATDASGWATAIRMKMLRASPKTEAYSAIYSAFPAFPCRASG